MVATQPENVTCTLNLSARHPCCPRYGNGLSHSLYNSREVGQRAAESIAAAFSSPFLGDSALPKLSCGRIATTALPGSGHFLCACAAGTLPAHSLDSKVSARTLARNVLFSVQLFRVLGVDCVLRTDNMFEQALGSNDPVGKCATTTYLL